MVYAGAHASHGQATSGEILLGKPVFQVDGLHQKGGGHLKMGKSIDWVSSWSEDGRFTIRSLLDQENEVKIEAHDPQQRGIKDVCLASAGKGVYTLGYDGILKYWDWSFHVNGKKQMNEGLAELEHVIDANSMDIKGLIRVLDEFDRDIADSGDDAEEVSLCDKVEEDSTANTVDVEMEVCLLELMARNSKIKLKIRSRRFVKRLSL
jgi:hypothetical protein